MSGAPDSARAQASRANGRKSGGPKSAAGKARAKMNARRHGLAVPLLADFAIVQEVRDLARRIEVSVTGAELDEHGHALACRIAATLIDLRRVRAAKLPLVAELAADLRNAARPLKALARLDRYERRTLSRRKATMREFDAFTLSRSNWRNEPGRPRDLDECTQPPHRAARLADELAERT
jgi:hypothetical protein